MKKIDIVGMIIERFKGLEKAIEFPGEKEVHIRGRNEIGKTRIIDAWNWIWGKEDSSGSSKFGLFPIGDTGKSEIFVTANVVVDGEPHSVSRLATRSVKKDGSTSVSTTTVIDESEFSESEFALYCAKEFGATPDQIRLCSNVGAFFRLAWKEQRAVLLKMLGENPVDYSKQLTNLRSEVKDLNEALIGYAAIIKNSEETQFDQHELNNLLTKKNLLEDKEKRWVALEQLKAKRASIMADIQAQEISQKDEERTQFEADKKKRIELKEKEILEEEATLVRLRAEFKKINESDASCIYCGSKLEGELAEKQKLSMLENCRKNGVRQNNVVARLKAELASIVEEKFVSTQIDLKPELARIEKEIKAIGPASISSVKTDLEEVIKQIGAMEERKESAEKLAMYKDLQKTTAINIEKKEKEIAELKQKETDQAKKLENFCDSIVPGLRFKLTKRLGNGKDEECCIVTDLEGCEIADCSHSKKIKLGIPMAEALQKHFGIQCPIFVDDAEAINVIPESSSQLIVFHVDINETMAVE